MEAKNLSWERIAVGLHKYLEIMSLYNSSPDLNSDTFFQRKYKGFYRVRRNDEFCKNYFQFMQSKRGNKHVSFEEVLNFIYDFSGNIEASFSSKLVATVNPNMPVWDSLVLENITNELDHSFKRETDKLRLAVKKYNSIQNWYEKNLDSEKYAHLFKDFDIRFPNCNITRTKKLDLILWQTR